MSEQPVQPEPAAPAAQPPAQPAQHAQHENPVERVAGWFRRDHPAPLIPPGAAAAVPAEVRAAFRAHAGDVCDLAAAFLRLPGGAPGAEDVAVKVLAVVEDAARIAGALHG